MAGLLSLGFSTVLSVTPHWVMLVSVCVCAYVCTVHTCVWRAGGREDNLTGVPQALFTLLLETASLIGLGLTADARLAER